MRPRARSRYLVRLVILLAQQPIDSIFGSIVVGIVDAGIQAISVPRNDTTKPLRLGQLPFSDQPQERPLAHSEIRSGSIGPQQARGIGEMILQLIPHRNRTSARKGAAPSGPARVNARSRGFARESLNFVLTWQVDGMMLQRA